MKELTEALARLMTALSSSEDKAVLQRALEVLLNADEHTLAALNTALKPGKLQKTKAAKSTKERKTKTATINAELVAKYVTALEESMFDAAEFKSVMGELKANKLVKAGEVSDILSRVRARDVTCSKKADGLKEIEQWYKRRRDTERRVGRADEIY